MGFEFLNTLQQNSALDRLPVIVLTSTILQPDERALLSRASLVMSKSHLASGTLIDAIGGVLRADEPVGGT
jgi:CheY-like chemotaxis protein